MSLDDLVAAPDGGAARINEPTIDLDEIRAAISYDEIGACVTLVCRFAGDKVMCLQLPMTQSIHELSGELAACAKELARMYGLNEIEARAFNRQLERDRVKAEREMKEFLVKQPTCAFCHRQTSVIDADGTRYCKRHGREHGVIVTGKI